MTLIGRKCACGSVWCLICFKLRRVPQIIERLLGFDWQSTRHVTLTIDRKKFSDGEQAHEYVTSKKLIAQVIHNLRRTKGITVRDWSWYLEWHRDGFPHWHLFIDVVTKGKEGMIGGDNLRQYWKIGAVRESHIRSALHWKRLTGYFQKHGYFEKSKAHQSTLPQWARQGKKRIRRSDSMRKPKALDAPPPPQGSESEAPIPQISWVSTDPKSYAEILDACGMKTLICRKDGPSYKERVFFIPYREFRQFRGEYLEGQGYAVQMHVRDYRLFSALYGEEDPVCEEEYPPDKAWC
jgi:hypothetical protein